MGDIPEREKLRLTFNEDAELYNRVRPGYPGEMLDHLCSLTGIGARTSILEIGCGTGQLTKALAQAGGRITALDIGVEMVKVARRNLQSFPYVTIHHASFEEWDLPKYPFDLVVSATAFHWIERGLRITKSAQALRPGGTLAIINTYHIAGGNKRFFEEVQTCYQQWHRTSEEAFTLPNADEIARQSDLLEDTRGFGSIAIRRYEWEETFSASEYCDLLRTYSDHHSLPPQQQAGLLTCIRHLINTHYNGKIHKRYLTELCTLTRL